MNDQYEIGQINFGVLSPDEIIRMSVCEINSNKLSGMNSVYDERMGVMENYKNCITCELSHKDCPGHFGHIKLNFEIAHPLYYKIILSFLKFFCYKCSSLLVNEDSLKLTDILKYSGELRFNKILALVEKKDICNECNSPQPKFIFSNPENIIYMVHKTSKETIKTQLNEIDIKNIFDNISDENISLLGLNYKQTHPKNLILSYIPVLPPVARPFIVAEGITCDDDLTLQYLEIIKSNNHLGNKDLDETKRQKHIQSLKFRIKCLFDNSQEKAKLTNGRPMKGIKKRLAGKEGQIRNNLMGKRVNKSARTVIGPDPTLRVGELAIPPQIANILSYPVRVNALNISELSDLVNESGANCILRDNGKTRINLKYALFRKGTELLSGDKIYRDGKEILCIGNSIMVGTRGIIKKGYDALPGDMVLRNGELVDFKPTEKRHITLKLGDIVERKLKDGDIVLLNRQPTLHKGSMLAQEIIIKEGKTIRMNLAITKTFNADFDGDEMNIHVPNGPEAEAELRLLSTTKANIISPQSTKANIVIVQDSLLGAYKLTNDERKIPKDRFFQILNYLDNFSSNDSIKKLYHIRRIRKSYGKTVTAFNGKGLFSFLLPNDLNYTKKNGASESEPVIKIFRGVLLEGTIDKSIIGGSHNSLIQILHKEYGESRVVEFINNVQFLSNQWLVHYGFSIGISDCIATKTSEINSVITKCFIEAKSIEETTKHEGIREVKINAALSKARNHGMKLAKDALNRKTNNFIATVTSGSKGDYFNIAQITGLLGQQNLVGERIKPTLNKNTRTLPHYAFELDDEEKYESRGFIKNSFIHGLGPREFWFHAMTGREGVTDTAMKTAQTGYIQRRMIKLLEDLQVKYDGTVRNASGHIIQLQYGDNGLDPTKTIIKNSEPQICDVERIIDKINTNYEIKNKIKI